MVDKLIDEQSAHSDEYQRKLITRNRVQYDTTFMDNKYKKRQHPGVFVQPKVPPTCSRNTPDKRCKLRMIEKYHRFNKKHKSVANVKGFRRHYDKHRYGASGWINKVSTRTWYRYSRDFRPNSAAYKRLKKFVARDNRTSKRTKRFYVDPEQGSFGVLPIFEDYLVVFRRIVATEYQWRSINWLMSEAQRILNNIKVMDLIKPMMSTHELGLLPRLKCTRTYINNIVVC